ncbi:MAG TPA: cupredoxin domain-containing protein [Steroidobacteraceae bacterium]|nr:cupredoxin domain-containing protein [Steroidobacteraceae bacterium]
MSHSSRSPGTLPVLLALLSAILCATTLVSTSHPASAAAAPAAGRSIVTIRGFSFEPRVLTVASGTTVLWINEDDDVHTIKSKDGPAMFQSPALDSGGKYGFTFDHPGTYHYICSVHPYMHGEIVVR